jgi:hypothetical protein
MPVPSLSVNWLALAGYNINGERPGPARVGINYVKSFAGRVVPRTFGGITAIHRVFCRPDRAGRAFVIAAGRKHLSAPPP